MANKKVDTKKIEIIANGKKISLGDMLTCNIPLDVFLYTEIIQKEAFNYSTELTPFERLYVFENSNTKNTPHFFRNRNMQSDLASLYLACGCVDEAIKLFEKTKAYSVLGHVNWLLGNYIDAKYYYSQPASEKEDTSRATYYRFSEDWEKLIKVNFYTDSWEGVLDIIMKMPESFTITDKEILVGSKVVSVNPLLQIAAISLTKINKHTDKELLNCIKRKLKSYIKDINLHIKRALTLSESEIQKLKKKILPKNLLPKEITDLPSAIELGNTENARLLLEFIKNIDINSYNASLSFKGFIERSDDALLKDFLDIIAKGTTRRIIKYFLIKIFGGRDIPSLFGEEKSHLIQKFFYSHPVIGHLYYSDMLRFKFESNIDITDSDLLNGIYRQMSSISYDLEQLKKSDRLLQYNDLHSASSWAKIKLQQWIDSGGKDSINDAIKKWATKEAKPVKSNWYKDFQYPSSPSEMQEWENIIKNCHRWISDCWQKEFGIDKWKSEALMYQLVAEVFKNNEIIRHARPMWLSPQHLDVYLPELKLAIEYMGQQHYESISIFGGEDGLKSRSNLDKRKQSLCGVAKVNIEYIKYDEDINKRLLEIRHKYTKP